jgi:hypothetical protein
MSLGRVGLRRVHRRRIRPTDRRLARLGNQGNGPGHAPVADGVVGTSSRGASRSRRRVDPSQRCRVAIHVDSAGRSSRSRGDPALDRIYRRPPTITPLWRASTASTRPSASAPPSSTRARTAPSSTSNSRPLVGSTGTTTDAFTAPAVTFHQWSSSKPTTRPSTESRNPHRSGKKPGALRGHSTGSTRPTALGRYLENKPDGSYRIVRLTADPTGRRLFEYFHSLELADMAVAPIR